MKKRNPEAEQLLAALADLRRNTELLVQEQKHLIDFCKVNEIDLRAHGYKGTRALRALRSGKPNSSIRGIVRSIFGHVNSIFSTKAAKR